MNKNIIEEYINFVRKQVILFYQIVLGNQFDKSLIMPFLDKYILIRYYNETEYPKEKDLVERTEKEMRNLIKEMTTFENKDVLKTIFSLFGYIFYFDDCSFVEDDKELLDILFSDEDLKMNFTDEQKKNITKFLNDFRSKKVKFNEAISSNQFFLQEKRLRKNLYVLKLGQNVKVSSLYSEQAIEKAFNTGIINEDKLFVTLIMASNLILQNAVGLDFSRYYLVAFCSSFFEKEKKNERIFKVIDNVLAAKYLILNIKYGEYLANRESVEELIKRGFSFSITIDHTFDEDYSKLILFSCVLLYKDDEKYDMIKENKDRIPSRLVIL